MKKKLLFVVLGITMLSTFGYAQTDQTSKKAYYELGGTFMFNTSTDSVIGGGINFAGISYLWNNIGLGAYVNLMYAPYQGFHIIVIDLLFGPAFKITLNERFRLPIAVGIYLDYPFIFGMGVAVRGFNIGAGANITAEYSLNEKVHIYGRIQGAYAFLGGGELFITPCIGIGF